MDVNSSADGEGGVTRSRQQERSQATRTALLDTARELFAERGYAAVGTEEIVRMAGVTRGALYHHFADKRALFEAVYEDVEQRLLARIAADAEAASDDPLQTLRIGMEGFLAACEDPAVQRIGLLDAPSVLGWETWREIGQRYGLGVVQGALQAAMDAGQIERQPVAALAHLLLGAVDEAALLVARADDGGRTRAEVTAALGRLLDALTARGPGTAV
jgi:AcrR family transcriptional regulator